MMSASFFHSVFQITHQLSKQYEHSQSRLLNT